MAQAPAQGVKFEIEGIKCVFGTLNNGDDDVAVLAVEKSKGADDYSWELQETLDYLKINFKDNFEAMVRYLVGIANDVLARIFGAPQEPESDIEKLQAAIMGSVTFNPASRQLVIQ